MVPSPVFRKAGNGIRVTPVELAFSASQALWPLLQQEVMEYLPVGFAREVSS